MAASFTPATLKFLRGIARHNDRNWFEARRDIFEAELKVPMLAVVEEISRAMDSFAPEHVRPANKIVMRFYRDTRFSSDKRPYKTHLAAWWARRGMHKTSGAGFYLDLNPTEVIVAAGVFMPEREQLLALRRWMSEHHAEYRGAVNKLLKPAGKALAMQPIGGESLKRMPKGFAADDPAAELLRVSNWGVSEVLPAAVALEKSFAAQAVRRFRRCAPLVAMLNAAILPENMAGSPENVAGVRRPRVSF